MAEHPVDPRDAARELSDQAYQAAVKAFNVGHIDLAHLFARESAAYLYVQSYGLDNNIVAVLEHIHVELDQALALKSNWH